VGAKDRAGKRREGGEMRKEEVVEILEEDTLPFVPHGVVKVIREYGLDGDTEALTREVLEEGVKRTMETLGKLWEVFGVSAPPEAEAYLREDHYLRIYGDGRGVWVQGKGRDIKLSLYDLEPFERAPLIFHAYPGLVVMDDPWFMGAKGRAYFRADSAKDPEALEVSLERAQYLRPFLPAIGLGDLEDAFRVLGKLREGERCVEGAYVLVRGDDFWIFRRGPLFGDLALDGAILAGEEVKITFPGDVEISFMTSWDPPPNPVLLFNVNIRWGEESVLFDGEEQGFEGALLHKNPILHAIQEGLKAEFEFAEGSPYLEKASPKMRTFLRALAYHKDPFRALIEGDLISQV
jgi:hypothetical protein